MCIWCVFSVGKAGGAFAVVEAADASDAPPEDARVDETGVDGVVHDVMIGEKPRLFHKKKMAHLDEAL